jgi:UDP-N-acetylmuramate--alanine ligase
MQSSDKVGSFLKLSPTIAVVTNIDKEHMDFFKNIDQIKDAFLSFINKVPFYGLSILCGDNEYIKKLLPKVQRRFITYGLSDGLDLVAKNIRSEGLKSIFEVVLNGKSLGFFDVPLIGAHNVCNCLAAIAVANELKMSMDIIREALKSFSGVQRRLELKGDVSGIKVVDDYGHHPVEIMATLKAVKQALMNNLNRKDNAGRLVILFQPHRYSRTRDLLGEFIDAFKEADKVVLMDIYPAGEKPLPGINSELLFRGIRDADKDIKYISNKEEILGYLDTELRDADTLLTLGAGDVWKIGEEFVKLKESKR